MASIDLQRVSKAYAAGQPAVRDVTLAVRDGELLVLVGPSGSGKSTVLRLIAGLETPTAGRVHVGGRDVTDLPPQERDLAMVFQNYALYPHKTVRDNLAFGLKVRGVGRTAIAERVARTAGTLGIEALLDRRPAQLSGGQRQRVALGRALVREPQAFLLDEPLSNLDPQLRVGTRAELALLHRRLGATMVYVTHDQEEAMTLGERVAVMREGAVEQVGPPLDLYHAPANLFVASFIGSPAMNFWTGHRGADGAWTGGTLRLPAGPGAPAPGGAEVVVGVRPHDVTIAPDHADLDGVVEVLEPFGATSLAHVRIADGEPLVRVVVAGDVGLPPGTRVGLALRRDRLHFFDAATGGRLDG
jgi:multiple sugar transport system ATP-binding protein